MVDHPEIYRSQADNYEALVSREDYQHHLLPAIQSITPLNGMSIVELGAGTGRLTTMLAPLAAHISAFDISDHMLALTREKLLASGLENWVVNTGEHQYIDINDHSVDLVISGWSVCYAVVKDQVTDHAAFDRVLSEITRVLKPGGFVILIETMGTGFTAPHPPDHLLEYFNLLRLSGFTETWIRTDYRFEDRLTAERLSSFFFSNDIIQKLVVSDGEVYLPECTGIWWKRI